jgi:hypothetical protein
MSGNVAVAQDPAGNLKPAKDKSTERIDGIVALIMAIGLAMVVRGAAALVPDVRSLKGAKDAAPSGLGPEYAHRPHGFKAHSTGANPNVAAPGRRSTSSSPLGHAARAVEPAPDLHAAARADQGQAHPMTAFQGAVDATFAAFGIDALYTPAGESRSRCG